MHPDPACVPSLPTARTPLGPFARGQEGSPPPSRHRAQLRDRGSAPPPCPAAASPAWAGALEEWELPEVLILVCPLLWVLRAAFNTAGKGALFPVQSRPPVPPLPPPFLPLPGDASGSPCHPSFLSPLLLRCQTPVRPSGFSVWEGVSDFPPGEANVPRQQKM